MMQVSPKIIDKKQMDSFYALFHPLRYGRTGASTIQLRVMSKIVNDGWLHVFISCSPGVCKGVRDGILVHQPDYITAPCNPGGNNAQAG